jgi:hypothetical protein
MNSEFENTCGMPELTIIPEYDNCGRIVGVHEIIFPEQSAGLVSQPMLSTESPSDHYLVLRSRPIVATDPTGLIPCFVGTCGCPYWPIFVGVFSNEWPDFVAMTLRGQRGCITMPWNAIYCNMRCDDILTAPSSTGGNLLIEHECGHICDLRTPVIGWWAYITGALPWIDYRQDGNGGLFGGRPFRR